MKSRNLNGLGSCLRAAFVIICLLVLCMPAFAFTYNIDEKVIPWGTGPGKVYTDYYDITNMLSDFDLPTYTTAWDAYGSTAYIIDMEQDASDATLIQYNFDTGELIEEGIGPMVTPDVLKILATEDEYFYIETLIGYSCYGYDNNVLWGLWLPESEELCFAYSDLYKLGDDLWGVVVKFFEAVPPRYELWKMSTAGDLVASSPVELPAEDSKVVDISPAGEITWSPFVDKYGAVYSYNDVGNLVRLEGDQQLEFPIAPPPEDFLLTPTPAKPFHDGTVFTFEYTDDGIRLKRYTLQPESGEPASPVQG